MVSVGIVGAGFSGLGMAIKLQKAGLKDFTIFEAAADIGGTWQANRYPGCACDVQSTMYSLSFEPYPWSEVYSGQPEILQYLHQCADKYKLWPHIKLCTRVRGARFDESNATWCLETDSGGTHTVHVLVLASGPLSMPTIPEVPGLSGFKGATLHTAAWDSSADLAGKKVAVVGTGASAIQLIPKLQQVARELVVFQRTPPWVLPRKELMPKYAVPAVQLRHPLLVWLQRQAFFWSNELLLGLAVVNNKQKTLKKVEALSTKHMQSAISDPELQQQLTPTYSVGCKRILASDTYYPALAQPNVKLVPAGLKQVHADGSALEAANGALVTGVDAIVFATGFDLKAPLAQFNISARGSNLRHVVDTKPEGYLGLAVAGFPNMFTLLGPNTGLGHHSVVFMAECQMDLIIQLLQKQQLLSRGRHCWVEVTQEAQGAFNAELQQRLQGTVWLSGCDSWYLTGAPQHEGYSSSSSSSNGTSSNGTSKSSTMAINGSSNGTHHLNGGSSKKAGAEQQPKKPRGGGAIMWPGLCVEFWWRTLWPVAGHWRWGTAAAAAADAGGEVCGNGVVASANGAAAAGFSKADDTSLQKLLSGAEPDSAGNKKAV